MKLGNVDLNYLSIISRIVFATDSTLTQVLEAAFLDKILIKKLEQKIISLNKYDNLLKLKKGEKILERSVLLRGTKGVNYLYAVTDVVLNRISRKFSKELIDTDTSIGYIWKKYKMELYKEFLDYCFENAGEYSQYFDIEPDDIVLKRIYIVYNHGKPITLIQEVFPNKLLQQLSAQYFSLTKLVLPYHEDKLLFMLRLYIDQLKYHIISIPDNIGKRNYKCLIDSAMLFIAGDYNKTIDILCTPDLIFTQEIDHLNHQILLYHCYKKLNQYTKAEYILRSLPQE